MRARTIRFRNKYRLWCFSPPPPDDVPCRRPSLSLQRRFHPLNVSLSLMPMNSLAADELRLSLLIPLQGVQCVHEPFHSGMRFPSTAPLMISAAPPPAPPHWSVHVEPAFAYREDYGRWICRAPSAEPHWSRLHQTLSSPYFTCFFSAL